MLESCQVRTVMPDDLPMLLEWRNHPKIRRFMFTQHEISLEEHLNWYKRTSQDSSRSLLLVEEANSAIGYVQFNQITIGGVSDWGFYARPDAPSGSGSKLGHAALQYAFDVLQLHKVCGQAIETNQASIRFHQKLGFTQEGVLREQRRLDHTYHAVICFGLLAHEWPKVKEAAYARH